MSGLGPLCHGPRHIRTAIIIVIVIKVIIIVKNKNNNSNNNNNNGDILRFAFPGDFTTEPQGWFLLCGLL